MKIWLQPEANVEKFVANEYVAACWGVTCDVPELAGVSQAYDDIDKNNKNVTHRAGFCGDPSHYQIELSGDGVPQKMVEVKTDKLGDLPCTLWTDATYTSTRDISTVKEGEYIYWTTSAGSRTWHHHGTVNGTYNHS